MKKRDIETASRIKIKLEDFEAKNPLPSELSKESITEKLKQQSVPVKKKAKIIEMKRLTSIAAAVIIIFGAVTAFSLFGGSSGLKLAIDNLNGKTAAAQNADISTAKNNKQILDIFKKLSTAAAKQSNRYTFNSALGAEKGTADYTPTAQGDTAANETSNNNTYGETNVQVKGIDEPDVMKNDGNYLYTVTNGNQVNIYSLLPADNMKLVSTIKFAEHVSKSEYANSLFVKGDLLVVFSDVNTYKVFKETTTAPAETNPDSTGTAETPAVPDDTATDAAGSTQGSQSSPGSAGSARTGADTAEPATAADTTDAANTAANDTKSVYGYNNYPGYYYSKSESVCTIYDISDRAAPKEIKKISQDGSFISARLINSEIYILSSYYVDLYAKNYLEDICFPAVAVDGKSQNISAADISITKNPDPSYLVVCGLNLDDLNTEPDTKAVLGGGSEAYCTADSLFASRTVYAYNEQPRDWGGDVTVVSSNDSYSTEIYQFAIGGGKVEFENSGKVAGQILNQFSMDQYNGYFRIATTQGDWGNTSSNVFILNDKLDVVGKIEKIAPKEQIFAVRFTGDTGYVVTYEQTDPLFVLDLSDPTAPKITGQLKLPGFSSYLQPVTDTLLLGIGQNGDTDGTTQGIKISLFDVSDPANPKEIDKYIIKGDCYTEAANNHKALMTYPEKVLFGIPVVKYDYQTYTDSSSSSGSVSTGVAFDGIVSTFDTFTVQNSKIVPVRSYKEPDVKSSDASTYYGGISRGTYVNDTLYTLSGAALTSFSMDTGSVLGTLKIDQPLYNYYFYGLRGPMVMY